MPPKTNSNVEQKQASERKWVEGLLVSAQNREWFGTITIEIKRGMIDLVRSEQTLKPPQLIESEVGKKSSLLLK